MEIIRTPEEFRRLRVDLKKWRKAIHIVNSEEGTFLSLFIIPSSGYYSSSKSEEKLTFCHTL